MNNKIWIFVKSILIPVAVGGIVGLITSRFIDYNELIKPPFAPPSLLFPIMWTTLYILMGVSYGILKSKEKVDSSVDIIYYLQLGINALWSIFFFVLKWRLFSAFWIVLLLAAVVLMIAKFYSKDKLAGILQIPYVLWVSFATYLNIAIYILNK